MDYCTHCGDYCHSVKDPDKGFLICFECGKILDQEIYSDEPTFVKDSSGQSRLAGNILKSIESGYSVSHERTIAKGRDEIKQLVYVLQVDGGDTTIDKAHRFYQIAVDKNFTRGRRTTQVAAACLYIACRISKKPYLLIDFSGHLQISVYVLGAVFLQLCQILLLLEHPVVQDLIDPSLFIHRFTNSLLGQRNGKVTKTALRIIASMKRDWMQTGRKPSGLCGAALYISALAHGYNYTKADIVRIVHVCEATLTKRLIEFENTDSGSLTIEEFEKADELDKEPVSKCAPKHGDVLCKHKDSGANHFAHGLCEECYNEFVSLSGGLEGGSEPPAFQRAEKQRIEAAKKVGATAEKEAQPRQSDFENSDRENNLTPRKDKIGDKSAGIASDKDTNGSVPTKDPEGKDENGKVDADPESLSDIDDIEVDGYLHNEEETKYKKIIWEEMNKEYLQEQAAKEALAAEMAARGVEAGQRKKRKRSEDTKNSAPAETPAEATCNILKRKGFGSKINVEAVGVLYANKDTDGSAKKKEEYDGEEAQNIDEAYAYADGDDYGDYHDYGEGGGEDYEYNDFDFD